MSIVVYVAAIGFAIESLRTGSPGDAIFFLLVAWTAWVRLPVKKRA